MRNSEPSRHFLTSPHIYIYIYFILAYVCGLCVCVTRRFNLFSKSAFVCVFIPFFFRKTWAQRTWAVTAISSTGNARVPTNLPWRRTGGGGNSSIVHTCACFLHLRLLPHLSNSPPTPHTSIPPSAYGAHACTEIA